MASESHYRKLFLGWKLAKNESYRFNDLSSTKRRCKIIQDRSVSAILGFIPDLYTLGAAKLLDRA